MQRMLLFAELSRLYEVGRGAPKGHFGNIHEDVKSTSSLPKESVSEKTAREVINHMPLQIPYNLSLLQEAQGISERECLHRGQH